MRWHFENRVRCVGKRHLFVLNHPNWLECFRFIINYNYFRPQLSSLFISALEDPPSAGATMKNRNFSRSVNDGWLSWMYNGSSYTLGAVICMSRLAGLTECGKFTQQDLFIWHKGCAFLVSAERRQHIWAASPARLLIYSIPQSISLDQFLFPAPVDSFPLHVFWAALKRNCSGIFRLLIPRVFKRQKFNNTKCDTFPLPPDVVVINASAWFSGSFGDDTEEIFYFLYALCTQPSTALSFIQ